MNSYQRRSDSDVTVASCALDCESSSFWSTRFSNAFKRGRASLYRRCRRFGASLEPPTFSVGTLPILVPYIFRKGVRPQRERLSRPEHSQSRASRNTAYGNATRAMFDLAVNNWFVGGVDQLEAQCQGEPKRVGLVSHFSHRGRSQELLQQRSVVIFPPRERYLIKVTIV